MLVFIRVLKEIAVERGFSFTALLQEWVTVGEPENARRTSITTKQVLPLSSLDIDKA